MDQLNALAEKHADLMEQWDQYNQSRKDEWSQTDEWQKDNKDLPKRKSITHRKVQTQESVFTTTVAKASGSSPGSAQAVAAATVPIPAQDGQTTTNRPILPLLKFSGVDGQSQGHASAQTSTIAQGVSPDDEQDREAWATIAYPDNYMTWSMELYQDFEKQENKYQKDLKFTFERLLNATHCIEWFRSCLHRLRGLCFQPSVMQAWFM